MVETLSWSVGEIKVADKNIIAKPAQIFAVIRRYFLFNATKIIIMATNANQEARVIDKINAINVKHAVKIEIPRHNRGIISDWAIKIKIGNCIKTTGP